MLSEIDRKIIDDGDWRFIKVNSLGHQWYIAKTKKDRSVLTRKGEDGFVRSVFIPEELALVAEQLEGKKIEDILSWLELMIEIKKEFTDATIVGIGRKLDARKYTKKNSGNMRSDKGHASREK